MTPWTPDDLFSSILRDYGEYMGLAERLESSNQEDTPEVKLAIVGFSLFQPVGTWNYEFYRFIRDKLDGDLSPESLVWHGDDAATYAQFACLAYGALLGKHALGEIDDQAFFLGEAYLPGFMHLHLEEIS